MDFKRTALLATLLLLGSSYAAQPPLCTSVSLANLGNSAYPLIAIAAVVTALVIGSCYMIGEFISNPKVILWAKTEIVQLFISIAISLLTFQLIGAFCAINLLDVYNLFGIGTLPAGSQSLSIYEGAEKYLVDGGTWVHGILNAARYHLGAYNMLESYGRYLCMGSDSAISGFLNIIFCLFGMYMGQGQATGTSVSPDAGHAYLAPAMTVAFNSLVFSYISSLNFLFILKYVYSGFVLFFLPLGIFLRAVPFLRTLGSLLMTVTLCFVMVYPMVLAAFYMDFLTASPILVPKDTNAHPGLQYANEDISDKVTAGEVVASIICGPLCNLVPGMPSVWGGGIVGTVFPHSDQSFDIIMLSGNSFLVGSFIPSLALLAAIASVAYVNRFLGEEIDLSRIVQMV